MTTIFHSRWMILSIIILLLSFPIYAQNCQEHEVINGVEYMGIQDEIYQRKTLPASELDQLRQEIPFPKCSEIFAQALQDNHRTLDKKVKRYLKAGAYGALTAVLTPTIVGLEILLLTKGIKVRKTEKAHVRYKHLLQTSLDLFAEAEDYLARLQENEPIEASHFTKLKAMHEILVKLHPTSKLGVTDLAQLIHQGNRLGQFCGTRPLLNSALNSNLEQIGKTFSLEGLITQAKDLYKHKPGGYNGRPKFLKKWPHQKNADPFHENFYLHAFESIFTFRGNGEELQKDLETQKETLKKASAYIKVLKAAEEERKAKSKI